MAVGGFWIIQLGILGILDKFLFRTPAPAGEKNIGPMIWAIVVLVLAGITALMGLWGLVGVFRMLGFISSAPVAVLVSLLSTGCQLALAVFLILGGVSRLKRQAPGMGVLKMILGIACVVLGISSYFWMLL